MSEENPNWQSFRLSDVLAKLPASAQSRYRRLRGLIEDSEALELTSFERSKTLDATIYGNQSRLDRLDGRTESASRIPKPLNEQLTTLRAELGELETERNKRSSIKNNTQQIVAATDAWLGAGHTSRLPSQLRYVRSK